MSRLLRLVALALLAAPSAYALDWPAAESKLGKPDRQWLEQVEALILPEEVELFERIDARDRGRFREVFWARRDPDPRTPINERREELEARRSLADRQLRQAGLRGSSTDMGHVLLLLGPPARVARGRVESGGAPMEDEECDVCDVELESSLIMKVGPTAGLEEATFVTWRYGPDPFTGIPRGLDVEFRSQSTLGYRRVESGEVERALSRARRLSICEPTLGYLIDPGGRLAPAAPAPGGDPSERALAGAPDPAGAEATVAFRATPAFFAATGGESYVPVLLEIEPDALTWEDGVAEMTISAGGAAVEPDGNGRFRCRVGLAPDADGRVRFDLPFLLPPGRRELHLSVQDDASGHSSAQVLNLVVPGFDGAGPTMSSVVAYLEARETELTPRGAGQAFRFGGLHVVPGREFLRDQAIGVLFFVYGITDRDSASPRVQYAFFQDGDLCGQTGESPLPVSGKQAIGSTEIPLESLAPGRYTLVVAVTDPASDTTVTRSVDFVLRDDAF